MKESKVKIFSIREPSNIFAIILCIILIPILIVNCCLIVGNIINPNEVPSLGKYSPLIVLTESMEPEIKSGDLIICKKVPSEYIKEGMIISFYDPIGNGQTVVTHKINRIVFDEETNSIFYYTQGINNNIEDRNPVPLENIIGVYTGFRLAIIGRIILFIQNPIGFLICLTIPILLFVFICYLKSYIYKKKKSINNSNNFNETQNRIEELEAELNLLKEKIKNKE